jgi:hypothetical protein
MPGDAVVSTGVPVVLFEGWAEGTTVTDGPGDPHAASATPSSVIAADR